MSATELNQRIWNQEVYDAWLNKYGEPKQYAERLAKNPSKALGSLIPILGDVSGKKILNLMGSNGSKAICLTLLGAEVTIVDFSAENRKYCEEMCAELGLHVHYIVNDVLAYNDINAHGAFDIVIAEMGIIHYFTDLSPFMQIPVRYLAKGGHFLLRDFHPVSTKLISSRGSTAKIRKHKVDGDYFSEALVEQTSALSKYQDAPSDKAYLRQWTLGEIVTATADSGLRICLLKEEPNLSSDVFDAGIPKTFILWAEK